MLDKAEKKLNHSETKWLQNLWKSVFDNHGLLGTSSCSKPLSFEKTLKKRLLSSESMWCYAQRLTIRQTSRFTILLLNTPSWGQMQNLWTSIIRLILIPCLPQPATQLSLAMIFQLTCSKFEMKLEAQQRRGLSNRHKLRRRNDLPTARLPTNKKTQGGATKCNTAWPLLEQAH